ncbi:hypothetical protein [Cupriavidus oxalaticus]|uniref:Response receiver domain-containing protein n=1 Tax=Cupriavidus oxalaticus TaxID=96344 RepID=A0A4V1BZ85_9BURK|nr:hypothetical protein [Cupriavidus oxalaticus]QBY54442.1 hypothetical protein E0W60_25940 [Cupriavidus oxalaticus]
MSLADLLAVRNIRTALIVDDVFDAVPTSTDIDPGNEAWSNFNDDITHEQRARIIEAYPAAASKRFDECVDDDNYVAAIWRLRDELGETAAGLFETYTADQATDESYVRLVNERLHALGLTVRTAGRDFANAAREADLVVIDLFFGKAQDPASLDESKRRLREALQLRLANPPLVILMSRSPRLESKRDEFRDEVGLLDSGFRILKKEDIENTNRLELQLERLAENSTDSHALARLFHALEVGVKQGAERTLRLLRKMRLSDVGQIQQLLLDAEGQPAGSYLVDVFDRVLQHEIEREAGIIDAALAVNGFSAAKHPPPYVAGSADLQELVQRLLTQHENRLRLPGSVGALVAFGDLLRMPPEADANRLQRAILVDLTPEQVLLVLTPACDLQRGAAPRILLLVGTVKPLAVKDWSYGDDARTSAIRIDNELRWVKWNLKHIDTVSESQISNAFEAGDVRLVGRLREGHALELQQRVLAGLGRIGQMAALPGTFPVELGLFYPDVEGRLKALDVSALADGAVCFVGRDENGGPMLRLVMTEVICDGVLSALAGVEEDHVAPHARLAFQHVKATPDLRRLMVQGFDLKGVNDQGWKEISSETGAEKGVRKMGLIAWNYIVPDAPLPRSSLNKAGIVFLIRDAGRADVPGLGDAIRSGFIEPAGMQIPATQLEESPPG